MPMNSLPPAEHRIEASVTIERPVAEVFNFYRDFNNLPRFLGDVMSIEPIDLVTSRWTIQVPLGVRVHWTTKVTEVRSNELISYETVANPSRKTCWEIHFAPGSDINETNVREVMNAPLGPFGRAAMALLGKNPAKEVTANLHRLKQVMETGHVTDTSYSVTGKFSQAWSQSDGRK